MNISDYKDKVRACWLGKNIGGSLGAPFECHRGTFDVDYYTHDIKEGALPNDDLDLQLVWLNAAEKYGKSLDSEILGEYWLSYIVASVSEYGMGKANMAMGIHPPLSGWYNNPLKNSCGCFIRSEIWACLAPGHPEIAAQYAYEDGICDHSEEGLYAEIFCAALQSAAFAESDSRTLMDIGLSYIPEDCMVALAVKTAIDCYDSGISWKEARKRMMYEVPGGFGAVRDDRTEFIEEPKGELGVNAPNNIGLTMIGWLYGEGDFSKSLCTAVGCGEDADCTGATLGAILGIIGGTETIPQKWIDPIGDEIKTICVDLTKWETLTIPKTVTGFTDRICRLMPTFMSEHLDMSENGISIAMSRGDGLKDSGIYKGRVGTSVKVMYTFRDKLKLHPFGMRYTSVPFDVTVDYIDGISISDGVEKKIRLHIENNQVMQQWLTVKWNVPEEWVVSPGKETTINLSQRHGITALTDVEYSLVPEAMGKGKYDIILEIKSNGRLSTMYIPVTLVLGPEINHWGQE